jgi:hypothetical protein
MVLMFLTGNLVWFFVSGSVRVGVTFKPKFFGAQAVNGHKALNY